MKHFCLLICFSMIAFSCKKDAENPGAVFIGKWKWIGTSGGLAGLPFQPATSDLFYAFTSDGRYTINYTGGNTLSGTYRLVMDNNINKMQMTEAGTTQPNNYLYSISHDTLQLMWDVSDAPTGYYVKQ